jgi:predicted acyltransferase
MTSTAVDTTTKVDRGGSRPAIIDRIASVDLFRGFTMFLLIGESTRLYDHLLDAKDSAFFQFFGTQLSHHQWHGLHFWDLIQPFFMFIVGVSIPFAVAARKRKGDTDQMIMRHAIKRSFLLLFFGWALYCIDPGRIVWRFQNVLAQLSVTYLVAFLIRNRSVAFQIVFTCLVLLITDLAYRFFPVEGFNQPWVAFHNLGAWANNKIEGVEKADIWASINAFPTIAHTVWGVLCGRLLMSDKTHKQRISILLAAAAACLVVGYSLDLLDINPIIKKIATSAFVFASGGWAILALCVFYWLLDVKKLFRNQAQFFIIVGMNSIFIYLFFEVGTAGLMTTILKPFTNALFFWTGSLGSQMILSIAVWAWMWYLCYWLYKKRIFFKI